ncbi:ESCRT-2 complex, Snf8,EAP30,Winged helix-turn-helix DNA-binding domain [Cinara cedri]|uniref:Vacuolar-sorting protein SNF8 n=1 Tax=Cinara cedri TaxID=506608 RepID=A0A5E4N420_9HEMI|nr:ESCRT-2 complex, Snf8,EAP30,Winged helix-turn-helix DNA-binding domain [Cinara cedri]
MRRRAGVGAVHKQKLEQEKYKDKGTVIQENQFEQMTKQMEVFRLNLEEFATKYKNEIKKNSQFRRQFQEMCSSIGVDPLASGKGFWSVLGIGDFYYELAVQIVEVCMATTHKNGGIIGLDELRDRLIKARGRNKQHQEITIDDLLCAARKLKIFGNGFCVIPVGEGQYMVQSVPGELSMDHTAVLKLVSTSGSAFITLPSLMEQLNWETTRATNVLNSMVTEGLCWIDKDHKKDVSYWFPSMFTECIKSS